MLSYQDFVNIVRSAVPRFRSVWLNSGQEASVSAPPSPPLFIVAGPGAGKTTVLALRVLKLIMVDGIRPEGVMATTFTKKAANELRSRILSWGYSIIQQSHALFTASGDQQRLNWLSNIDINLIVTGTLDSIAQELISDDRAPGESTPTVIEDLVARTILRQEIFFPMGLHQRTGANSTLLQNHLLTFNPSKGTYLTFGQKVEIVHSFAQRVLQDSVDLNSYAAQGSGHQLLADLVRAYLTYLENEELMDFAMLEHNFLDRLSQGRMSRFCQRLQALLVDEFQDTNYLQEQIYYQICRRTNASLTVVGDDDQSIYRFRGATVEIFADFPRRITAALGANWFPNRRDFTDNFRSTDRIVRLCNHFITSDPGYLGARVPNKTACVAAGTHAQFPANNIPVLGMFRNDVNQLTDSLTDFLIAIFQGSGVSINMANGHSFSITRGQNGNYGDAVYLGSKVGELNSSNNSRLPLLLRNQLDALGVPVFNPRGRELARIEEVGRCLGIMLECIDPNSTVQSSLTITNATQNIFAGWRRMAQQFVTTNPFPGGLQNFISNWQARRAPRAWSHGWPREWPLLELLFTVVTWIPSLRDEPEGQIYLEAMARTIAQMGSVSIYRGNIETGTRYAQNSIKDAIRLFFEPLAEDDVDVNEEIMPYVPRNYFPIMTVHQAKGLEFPLTIVDVGSDYKTNHHKQKPYRYPVDGSDVHFTEDHIEQFSPVGAARVARTRRERAFDDLRRLYYVAKSRSETVLLLVGLNSVIANRPVLGVAAGDTINGNRIYNYVPASQASFPMPFENIVLI